MHIRRSSSFRSIALTISLIVLSSGVPGPLIREAGAQDRWHIVRPDRVDTFYRGITSIACSGENCTATGVVYSEWTGDSNVIIHSTDGGLTWNEASDVPQWYFYSNGNSSGKNHYYFDGVQQLDPLNAIVVDLARGALLRTSDGWMTCQLDTTIPASALYGLHFANLAEGMVDKAFGFYLSTVDSGKHWTPLIFHGATSFHSYGGGMFRVFQTPRSIFTTHDSWKTIDTTFISPFTDTSLHPGSLIFGLGDSLAIVCSRWEMMGAHPSVAIALSTDLGAHWSELPVPRNNGIYISDIPTINWERPVLGGVDSIGRILVSTDRGATWKCDTVRLSDGVPYFHIRNVVVSGSGRIIAAIISDSNLMNSTTLAYLESGLAAVSDINSRRELATYPNPATSILHTEFLTGPLTVYDPLGRACVVARSGNTLDISRLPTGVYYVSDGASRARFVKE